MDPSTTCPDLDAVCTAIAHPQRRAILRALDARGGRLTAGEIAGRFDCAWPTTTRHLRVLEQAGLVTVERRGRERLYALVPDRLNAVLGGWMGGFSSREGSRTAPPADPVHRLPEPRPEPELDADPEPEEPRLEPARPVPSAAFRRPLPASRAPARHLL